MSVPEKIGSIELTTGSEVTFYEDGSALIHISTSGITIMLHLRPEDMAMIEDWLKENFP